MASLDLYTAVHQRYLDILQKYPDVDVLFYTIQPASTTTAQAGEARGGNTMG